MKAQTGIRTLWQSRKADERPLRKQKSWLKRHGLRDIVLFEARKVNWKDTLVKGESVKFGKK